MDLTSVFRGVTTPERVLYDHIEQQGWTTNSVAYQGDAYVAKGSNAHGEKLERTGPDANTALSNLLVAITRKNYMHTPAQAKVSAWASNWTNQVKEIADAYVKLPVYDPKAAGAWKELADDSVRRMAILGQQIEIEVTDDPEPYASQQEMCQDLHQNKHFLVSRANTQHPVWTTDQVVAFRVVHDIMGHCVTGGAFDWVGENAACGAHFPLLSPNAQQALFTECIGQAAYAAFYRSFGPMKVAFMEDFLNPAQEAENPAAHQGIHPSQTLAPTSVPTYMPEDHEAGGVEQKGYVAPHMEGLGLTPVLTSQQVLDPNHAYQTGLEPHPDYHAILHYGDPLQAAAVKDTAAKIDTGWAQRNPEDPGDRAIMKQAIVNAFRTVLLSPRKDLRWNAIHYQDIAHVPADVKDPKVYWDTLEQKRQNWNGNQVRALYDGKVSPQTLEKMVSDARVSHQEWRKFWPNFFNVVYQQIGDYAQALDKAERMAMEWQVQEHERLEMDDREKDPTKQSSADALERKATKAMVKRMKQYIKDFQPSLDFALAGQEQMDVGESEQDPTEQIDRYGAFMGTHLKSIAQVSQYADQILDAAIKDVQEQDGAGHHFRAEVLRLGVPGVGPKVASFAWLLLQPLTSQLGTIDTHMMDVLGRDYEKEMNNRDYFKFERELQAGRDAAGYQHVPLGQFQWGMWDHKRTGPGSHQDHSAMRVLDPVPHDQIDWAAKSQNLKGDSWHDQAPEWWQATSPARQQVAQHFEDNIAGQVPRNAIPWTNVPFEKAAKGKPFSHYWEKEAPHKISNAEKMAEYAAGDGKTSREEAIRFIEKHRKDIEGSADDFMVAFLRKYDRMKELHPHASITSATRPYVLDQETQERISGEPGEALMSHLKRSRGLSTAEAWALEDEAVGKAQDQEDHDPNAAALLQP